MWQGHLQRLMKPAGLWWFPSPHHGEEHGIGQRRTSQITLGVRAAQQKRAEPVGLDGDDHAELVAGAEHDPQRLTVTVSTGYREPVGI